MCFEVLINLCFANLLSAVMVKSISIVHNAYAVAANTSQSNIAFCMLYSFGYRLTWAVLPWSITVLSWLSVLPRLRRLEATNCVVTPVQSPEQQITTIDLAVSLTEAEAGVLERESEVPAGQEKAGNLHLGQLMIADRITLGSIWLISLLYGLMTEQFLSKEVDLPCSVSNNIQTYQGITSVSLAIILPTVCGPAMAGVTHLVISVLNTVRGTTINSEENRKMEIKNLLCILCLILVFLPTYISSMILTELYLDIGNIFLFVLVKYIIGNTLITKLAEHLEDKELAGTCQHSLVPLAILITKNEIYQSAKEVEWSAVVCSQCTEVLILHFRSTEVAEQYRARTWK